MASHVVVDGPVTNVFVAHVAQEGQEPVPTLTLPLSWLHKVKRCLDSATRESSRRLGGQVQAGIHMGWKILDLESWKEISGR